MLFAPEGGYEDADHGEYFETAGKHDEAQNDLFQGTCRGEVHGMCSE